MSNGVFNIARGRVNEYVSRVNGNDPANSAIIAILLKVTEADAALMDHEEIDALLTAAGNTEADFASYARIVLSDTDVSEPAPDHTNNWQASDLDADPTWANATTGQNIVRLIFAYDDDTTGGDDTNLIPLTYHDFVATTDGNDLVAQINVAGWYRAASA